MLQSVMQPGGHQTDSHEPSRKRAAPIDLLFASSGIESEIAQAAESLEIASGLTLPVATTGHLIALKLLARNDKSRPQDLADLRELILVATPDDLAIAQSAVALITERGFNRDRDLLSALGEIVAGHGH